MTVATTTKPPLPGFSELDELVARYRPLPGIPDEFIGADGKPKPAWLDFIAALTELGPDEIKRRFATADRHIRDTGVSYRAYGDESERAWPLGHLPLLIGAEDWKEIAAGVEQRAELLEAVLEDIYGAGKLIADGAIPATAVAGCPDYLQPVAGLLPADRKYLHFYAVDLGRGPDGRWWVLGDRTQAPSGAGYALANRLVLSRTFPQLYRDMNIERLAPFFDAYRAGLTALSQRSDPRICLLTPGPYNETYFEQAYLARYLGLLLVEGGDLTVRDNLLHVRTIAGLKQADVILRRIDSDFADPLELNARSRLGVPGLIDVVRDNGVALANALGSGVVETPVMMSFMPKLCRHVLKQELRLPNIATWWCGQKREREAVLAKMDTMALAGAFGNSLVGGSRHQSVLGGSLTPEEKVKLRAEISERGIDYVGQEVVNLSTTPVWIDGHLVPRPFVLRVFAARTPDGWKVMPGGFCRTSDRADARAVAMGAGVESADVWVLGEKPAELVSLLPADESVRIRRIIGNLPSRAADNLFWFGRYLERCEAILRLVRSLANRLIDASTKNPEAESLVGRLESILEEWGAVPKDTETKGTALAAIALSGEDERASAIALVEDARRAASFIRERLSADTWRLIEDLHDALKRDVTLPMTEADVLDRADAALRTLSAISGLSQENMNRGAGWHLLDMGRRVERAINTCHFARDFAQRDGSADGLGVLLELVDSQITYRSRYLVGLALVAVRDMVLLDAFNPRSVAFQVERLHEHLMDLPLLKTDGMLEAPRRLIVKLCSDIATSAAADLDNKAILVFERTLLSLAEAIGARYFLQGPNLERAEKAMGLA
ncbi:circularly permuted type 2 ATP-grasp protein [Beijerinckia sp. L45]|uniref:circularly permuted type 2 ATP-grasp protein n=1 Tax=Beijerinckia sp. L45 TaxID=1641855 RepID=UPI00131DAE08|nr:circularly permuted type 2 ATP-grasp protein [Beijerinckia sp. L45]